MFRVSLHRRMRLSRFHHARATGTQYTVANTKNYYWAKASGTVVGTDTDTPPDSSFTRLNRVPPQSGRKSAP